MVSPWWAQGALGSVIVVEEVVLIHVHQCFQAVGHGTFFTGFITDSESPGPDISWVYDCGSKRTTRIEEAIDSLGGCRYWPRKIDLFVLSHFDDDHVNGVEQFLRTQSVRCLALPYMDAGQRLGQAASVGCDPCSASTALFQLDPLQWLNSRGLSDRVDSILLVRGGPDGGDNFPPDIDPRPFPGPAPSDDEFRRSPAVDADDRLRLDYPVESSQGGRSGPVLMLWQHGAPFAPSNLPVEFMFFNSEQPDLFRVNGIGERVARRSGASVGILRSEIDAVMRRYGLANLSKPPRRGWRDGLRHTYDRHFGETGQERNNISLCLLVRPLGDRVEYCSIFEDGIGGQIYPRGRAGLLCLGDLRVDGDTLNAMQRHFGPARWASLSLVQVPHHGSRHSWVAGNAAAFAPDYFVHCVPDSSKYHPHEKVELDLHGYNVFRADYGHRVALDYHF